MLVARVRAQRLAVLEEARLVEFTHHFAQLQHCIHQASRVTRHMKVALRRLVHAKRRLRTQIEHQIEGLADRLRAALEINGTGRVTGLHTIAVALAGRHVHLVAEVDGALGAGRDAGIAARAQLQVDGVVARPLGLEGAQPSRQSAQAARMHDTFAGLRQGVAREVVVGAGACVVNQLDHLQLVGQHPGCGFGGVGRADHQHSPARGIAHRAHGCGQRQLRGRNQRRHLGHGASGVT